MEVLSGFLIEVDRDAVVHEDLSGFERARDAAIELSLRTGDLCHIEMVVDGYDADPRSLYEVPEVRRWVRDISRKWDDYLFWLTPGTLWMVLLCTNTSMWFRQADNKLRIELDPDPLNRQYAFSLASATALLTSRGMKKRRLRRAEDRGISNILAVPERRQLGDYVVLHPEERAVVTYRSEG